ncbi:hypothetical protein EQW76_00750 [Rhizobium sp. rho-13.1]|uniref:hypothetical protein n=1 Tax=Rhizobium sp. rho-13.1 TaxID=2506431 RepID=UPI00115EB821|nr:hypothetical protein [Rhizobium sp. rho-13.1]TQX91299.1 hypothetical protein EQW76_00750 [Rhizobium sp. rho-13.1]
MNQNSALRSELSEEAALMADLSTVVKARFVEAADTMLHLDVKGLRPAAVKAFWPEHVLDYKEVRLRYRPSSAAISRAEEVMYGWLLDYVHQDRRALVGKWSICLAAPHIEGSFREYCQKTNRIRRTAERWLNSEFTSVSSSLLKFAQTLHEPNWSRVSPMMPNSSTGLHKVGTPVDKSISHWLPADAKPIFDPASPELEALIKRIERGNRRRQGRKQAA